MDMIQRMYIGPSVPGVVKRGTVFLDRLPEELVDVTKKMPGIKNLVVPIEEITKATQALKEPGSGIKLPERGDIRCLLITAMVFILQGNPPV